MLHSLAPPAHTSQYHHHSLSSLVPKKKAAVAMMMFVALALVVVVATSTGGGVRATPSRWRCAVRHSWEGRNPRRHAAPTYVRKSHACASTRKTAILITFIASTLAKRSPPVPSPSRCAMRKFSVCVACEHALRHSLLYVCNVSYVWIYECRSVYYYSI